MNATYKKAVKLERTKPLTKFMSYMSKWILSVTMTRNHPIKAWLTQYCDNSQLYYYVKSQGPCFRKLITKTPALHQTFDNIHQD